MKLSGIMFAIIITMGGLGYWYYTDTQKTIAVLTENNAKLNVAVETNEATITAITADFKAANEEITRVNAEFAGATVQNFAGLFLAGGRGHIGKRQFCGARCHRLDRGRDQEIVAQKALVLFLLIRFFGALHRIDPGQPGHRDVLGAAPHSAWRGSFLLIDLFVQGAIMDR